MKRVLLIDADSKEGFPNLALMKLSAWMKNLDWKVDLIRGIPDAPPLEEYYDYYISCIFFQNKDRVLEYAKMLPIPPKIGGVGMSDQNLPDAIEHILPDYDLYDIDFSMGFTSRGCIRKCPWCVVPQKEGKIRDHAPITEFLDPRHKRLYIMDNNFQASPKWKENLQFIIDNNLEVNFSAGLDIRLVNKTFAKMLNETRFTTRKFNIRRVCFAFDSIRYEKSFRRGFGFLVDAGINPASIMVYVLCGFNTTIEQDMDRVRIILEFGGDPYIMRYNMARGPHDILFHYARYINRRIYRSIEAFHDYKHGQSQAAIKAVFGDSPTPDWDGYYCSQGAYAWTNLKEKESG